MQAAQCKFAQDIAEDGGSLSCGELNVGPGSSSFPLRVSRPENWPPSPHVGLADDMQTGSESLDCRLPEREGTSLGT